MKHSFDGLISSLDTDGERISELEGRNYPNWNTKIEPSRKNKTKQERASHGFETMSGGLIYVQLESQNEKRRTIWRNNSQDFSEVNKQHTKDPKAQRTWSWINTHSTTTITTTRHTVIKLLKVKHNNLGSSQRWKKHYKQRNRGESKADFWPEIVQIRGQWSVRSTKSKKKNVNKKSVPRENTFQGWKQNTI